MNVQVVFDIECHYIVEAYLPDKAHPGYCKYQPLRKFSTQGDAILFAQIARRGKIDCEKYARTYNASHVNTLKIKFDGTPILGRAKNV